MININDYSHSGDYLSVVAEDENFFVKKTFVKNIDRAEKNVKKQIKFKSIFAGLEQIRAAQIIDYKKNDKSLEIKMPYIEGITAYNLTSQGTKKVSEKLKNSLSLFLYYELSCSKELNININLFKEKFESVIKKTKDPELNDLLFKSFMLLNDLNEEIVVPIGPCHGDLTLSNIILDPYNGLSLIDFLDTYLESPLQDVAKLKQDFEYGWSFRLLPASSILKSEIFCKNSIPVAIKQIERIYPLQVKLFTMLALVRIAPYVKDEITKCWLIANIKIFMKGF